MTKINLTLVQCDRCQWGITFPGSKDTVSEALKKGGWSIGRIFDYCPNCAKIEKEERIE